MSHRALVAVPTEDPNPTYDVYHSRNGASNFKLYPYLKEFRRSDLDVLNQLPHRLPRELDRLDDVSERFSADSIKHPNPDEPIVREKPIQTGITIDDLLAQTNYILYDALYVIKGERVTTYYLSWSGTLMQSFLASGLKLSIYPQEFALELRNGKGVDDETPYYEFTGDDFLYPSESKPLRPDSPPTDVIEQIIAEDHMGIFRNLTHLLGPSNDQNHSASVVMGQLTLLAQYTSELNLGLLQQSKQSGVAIKTDLRQVPPDLAWGDLQDRANKLRWFHSLETNRHLYEGESQEKEMMERFGRGFIDKNKAEFGSARPSALLKQISR